MKLNCFVSQIALRTTLLLFVLFSTVQTLSSQQLLIDSLLEKRHRLETSNKYVATDTNYIKTLNDLAKSYVYLNKDSTNSIATRALELSKKINFKKGIAGSKLALGIASIFEGDFDSGFENADEARKISETISADTIYLKSLNAIGMGYFMKTDYPKGYEYCQLGKKRAEELKNNEMAMIFNLNIATSFAILNDPEQALPYYEKCLELLETKNDLNGLAQVKSNMGYMFIKTNELAKAKKYLNESLKIFKDEINSSWQAFVQINLGEILLLEKKYDSALILFNDSNKLLKDIYDPQRKAETYLGLSQTYFLKNDITESEIMALKADSIAKSVKFYEGLVKSNDILYKISKSKSETEKAINHLETSKFLSDSMEVAENRTKLLMLETQNNFRKEQFRIKEENEKKLERQKLITAFAIILLISTGIILFLIRRNIKTQKAANNELIKINKIKDKVFSIVGHDLKTPISTLQELLELYRNKAISATEIAEMTPRLKNNVDHSAFTLNNLLLWAENQMHGVKTSPEYVNVKEAVTEIIGLYQEQIEQKEIIIDCQIPINFLAFTDPEHLNIILRNIILNAIKYSKKKGVISFYGKQMERQIIFSVCDDGIGMSKKLVDNILQNDNITSNPGTLNEKGTGLGLNICIDLLVANNGNLQIESEPENGSCFKVQLPK